MELGKQGVQCKMVSTIIFDLGGVYFTDGTRNTPTKFQSLFDIAEAKTKKVLSGELGMRYRMGLLSEGIFWKEAQAIFGTNLDFQKLRDAWFRGYRPIAGTVDLIKELKKQGYEILYLSDNVRERVEYLDTKYGFMQHFDSGVFSYVAKTVKPDPEIYRLVLKCTHSEPFGCVFIDDKECFLDPARALGMHATQFHDPLQVKDYLISLGVVFKQDKLFSRA